MDLENLFDLMKSKGFQRFSGHNLKKYFKIIFTLDNNKKDSTIELKTFDFISWDLHIQQQFTTSIDYTDKSGQEIFEIIRKWEQ
jgi:hypothetical protein